MINRALLQILPALLLTLVPVMGTLISQLAALVREFFTWKPSGKHMSGRDLDRLEPNSGIDRRAIA
jgi:hypothetical protein